MNLPLPLQQKKVTLQELHQPKCHMTSPFPSLIAVPYCATQWCCYPLLCIPAYCCFQDVFSCCGHLLFTVVVAITLHSDSCSWCCSSCVALPVAIHWLLLLRKIISPHWLLPFPQHLSLPNPPHYWDSCHWNHKMTMPKTMNSNNTSNPPPETVGKTKEEEDSGMEALMMPSEATSTQSNDQPTNQMSVGGRTDHFQTSTGIVLIRTRISCFGGDKHTASGSVWFTNTQHPWAHKKARMSCMDIVMAIEKEQRELV